jgi:membrane protein implicated in regulation of membrane protease activity
LVGHVGRVEKMPLGEHLGQLDIDGDTWSFVFQGTAAKVNELVRVVRHEATVLYVEKANPKK